MQQGKELAAFDAHTSFIKSLAFSADGKTLISGSWDRTVKWWRVPSRE
jgi:WD40 repeat protein